MPVSRLRAAVAVVLTALLTSCASGTTGTTSSKPSGPAASSAQPSPASPASSAATAAAPSSPGSPSRGSRPDHVLVVVMENHGYDSIIGNPAMPWLNALPAAVMTDWHAVRHPSQPNYLAMLTGSTHVTDDHCPVTVDGPSLAGQLLSAGLTFTGWSEGLPAAGSTVCRAGDYARKHNPWVDVAGLPASVNQPMTSLPADWSRLPDLAFLIPDQCHDIHSCPEATGDAWLRATLTGYVTWARTHHSLLVVTFDEDEGGSPANRIPTLFAGPMVRLGRSSDPGDHYRLLRTLEAFYGLPGIGEAASRQPLTSVFEPGTVPAPLTAI